LSRRIKESGETHRARWGPTHYVGIGCGGLESRWIEGKEVAGGRRLPRGSDPSAGL